MRAIQINSYGGPSKIKMAESACPEPLAHQVRVKINDAGVNPIDWKIRAGMHASHVREHFPLVLGQDFAGEVVKLGVGVANFAIGDRVVGFAEDGAYAEYAVVDTDQITHTPQTIEDEVAAAVPTSGLTAYQLIMDAAAVQPGQLVLIHGASGGVGSVAVQIANWRGAHVIANASAKDADYLRRLGAEEIIDHYTERFENLVSGADAVIDLVGGETAERSLGVLRPGGVLVSTVGATANLFLSSKSILTVDFVMKRDIAQLAHLMKLIEEGFVEIRIAETLPLDQAAQAHILSQRGHLPGKIVLRVDHSSSL
ncbi:MAG: NADP-dependent oxidoreductase [Bdellovibrionales bacterium]|nr:NADP-dependent oxidoreductase [Oligoflexia bacterium]